MLSSGKICLRIISLTTNPLLFVVGLLLLQGLAFGQKKIPRIGYISGSSASSASQRRDAFRQGLRELGYVEGQNIAIEYRYAEGNLDRMPDLVDEMIRSKVDVIVSGTEQAIRAAQKATKTIPYCRRGNR